MNPNPIQCVYRNIIFILVPLIQLTQPRNTTTTSIHFQRWSKYNETSIKSTDKIEVSTTNIEPAAGYTLYGIRHTVYLPSIQIYDPHCTRFIWDSRKAQKKIFVPSLFISAPQNINRRCRMFLIIRDEHKERYQFHLRASLTAHLCL